MAFYNTQFPTDVSYGSRGGPRFNTTIIRLRSGHEQRNVNWQYPLHDYNVAYGIRNPQQMGAVRKFFMAMHGMAHTWRFKDWGDYASGEDGISHTPLDAVVSIASGFVASATSHWQLEKQYAESSITLQRKITLPISDTVSAAVNGYNFRGNQVSTNEVTGVMELKGTFIAVATARQTNPLEVDIAGASSLYNNGMRSLYFKGIAGMTELNGKRLEILEVSAGTVYFSADATGWGAFTSATAGGAWERISSAEYASTGVSVTAGFEFDVKCRFDSDVFEATHEGFEMLNMDIPVTEIRED